jgi:hypothetical protein
VDVLSQQSAPKSAPQEAATKPAPKSAPKPAPQAAATQPAPKSAPKPAPQKEATQPTPQPKGKGGKRFSAAPESKQESTSESAPAAAISAASAWDIQEVNPDWGAEDAKVHVGGGSSSSYASAAAIPPSEETLAKAADEEFKPHHGRKKPGKPKPCKWGGKCRVADCTFGHPADWDASKNVQPCKYGTTCRSKFCNKGHPDGYFPLDHVIICRWDAKCEQHSAYDEGRCEKDCPFLHTDEFKVDTQSE